MVEIAPFRGLRYDPARVDPSAAIAPPYDVVGEDAVAALHARSPWNVAHVESPRDPEGGAGAGGGDRYARAAALLREWEREGVLVRDEAPALYAYEQRTAVGGERVVRRCCFARLRLSPYGAGEVRPHERTMAAPKADRLALLRAARVNVSPLLVMYRDASGAASAALARAAAAPPAFEATDDRGDEHRLWVVSDPADVAAIAGAAAASNATVADGHHRYETALAYLEERGGPAGPDEGARWVLAGLVAEDDPGLVVLPTHRLVAAEPPPDFGARLAALYGIEDASPPGGGEPSAADALRLWERVRERAGTPGAFGVMGLGGAGGLGGGGLRLLRARDEAALDAAMPAAWPRATRALDVLILNETILRPLLGLGEAEFAAGRVAFSEDAAEAWEWTRAAPGRLAFLLNPTRVAQVVAAADAGETLPQKSTFFYPKLATGMVLNPLDG